MILAGLALALAAGCGSGGGTEEVAAAPGDPDAELTGTLRVFAYEDSVTPEMIDPVLEDNPGLKIETATFDSNEEAAAKLAGGFEADVVEICLDEMEPLVKQDLLRPIDPKGITDWDELEFTDAEGIVLDGKTYGVPLSAGLEGLVYNSEEVPEGIDQLADLFDPQFAGRSTIHGSYALPAIAEAALALGIEDPIAMDRRAARADEAVPDRPQGPVPLAVGLGLRPGQPVQVGRGRRRRPPGRSSPSGSSAPACRRSGRRPRRARCRGSAASRSPRRPRTPTRPTR